MRSIRPSARRACMSTASCCPITAGRTSSELFAASVQLKQPIVSDADIERVLAAGSHHSAREGRAVLHSLPIGYALDDNRGVRDPRGMIGGAAWRRHACGDHRCRGRAQPDPAGRALPHRRRGDGCGALRLRACGARRGRGRSRRRGGRHGRRHHHAGRVRGGALHPCRWLHARRAARHDGHRARAHHDDRGCRTA